MNIDPDKRLGKYLGNNHPKSPDYVDISSYLCITASNDWILRSDLSSMFKDPLVVYYNKNNLLYFKDEKDLLLWKLKYRI